MKILITGGAGYIGSELINYLIDDHEITVLDNLMYDPTTLLRYTQHPNFNFVKGDVRDLKILRRLLSSHDIILPLADIS